MSEPVEASPMDELQKDPALGPIIANNRGKKLYDALRAHLKTENNPTRRRLVEEVLGNRRWFLEPLNRAPTLSTVNGIGTMLYGSAERESDGTYVTTLFFTFFFVPIFPVAQYLVRDLGGRKWSFFGKVPPSRLLVGWRLSLLMAAAAVALGVMQSRAHSDVQLVNGLDVPVKVMLGKLEVALPANDHTMRRLSSGSHAVKTTASDGRVLEELKLSVPRSTDVVVYNVLGAAPLYRQPISYYSAGHEGNSKDEPILEVGRSVVIQDHIDYVFTEPLKEISMPSGSNLQVRWRFDVFPGGWKLSAGYLLMKSQNQEAARLAEAVAQATPDDERALETVSVVIERARGMDGLSEFATRLAEKFPDAIEPQRLYQSVAMLKGARAELIAKYRQRAEQHPDSATAGYLVARLELPAEALPHYQELARKFPQDLHVRRGLAWVLMQLRRFPESAAEFETLDKLPHSAQPDELEGHAQVLVALGKAKQAAELVAAHVKENPNLPRLYARVARIAGKDAPQRPDAFIEDKGVVRSWYEAMFGNFDKQPPIDGPEQAAFAVLAATRKGGPAALAALEKAGPPGGTYLERSWSLLLAAEALREKDRKRAERILDELSPVATAVERAAILEGKDSPELLDLPLDTQATLELARGWKLGDPKLVEKAKADDLLRGAVATAVGWR